MTIETQFQKYLQANLPDVTPRSAQAVLDLYKEGATVPFIARYRKEKTGNLNEVQIRGVIELEETWNEITKRQAFILKEIEKQGNLSAELQERISQSFDLVELDEIYAPFKKKKKTKATVAREAGLLPLADWIWGIGQGESQDLTLEVKAKEFLNVAAGFATYELVLKGAQDIIVERLTNNQDLRKIVRDEHFDNGFVVSQKTKFFKSHSKFEMYGEFRESVKSLSSAKTSYRYLAMRRGWHEGELKVSIEVDEEKLYRQYQAAACKIESGPARDFLDICAKTALTVHVIPSIANEVHRKLKELADQHAIAVFADNLRRVLMSSPFGAKIVLGVDPGLRTGAKLALIDKSGHFISHTVLQILGDNAEENAKKLFSEVFKQIKIDAVAVGNGTAGRETEAFLRKVFEQINVEVPVILVNESGASVYSASEVAREEFPDLDLTVRGAISIARRLQDPLAELVKVEPKSIGVGQYQHDVSQPQLKKSLDYVVESCVNQVGIDLNTASTSLLRYVSGIGEALAKSIVDYRREKGLFSDRDDLLKVPSFSTKTFEQAAGFLRIYNGKSILDSTGVHPERYTALREMAQDLGVPLSAIVGEGAHKLKEKREKWIQLIGEYTFDDIVSELERPGRDPRDVYKVFKFREDIHSIKDLKPGITCPGIVTNVTNFGAFVDIGVHQDGLVHISHLSHKFVDDPKLVVSPGDQVQVKVLAVDLDKNQISLTMLLEERPQSLGTRGDSTTMRVRPAREKKKIAGEGRGPRVRKGRTADGDVGPSMREGSAHRDGGNRDGGANREGGAVREGGPHRGKGGLAVSEGARSDYEGARSRGDRGDRRKDAPPPPKQVPAGKPYKIDPKIVQQKLKEIKARSQKKDSRDVEFGSAPGSAPVSAGGAGPKAPGNNSAGPSGITPNSGPTTKGVGAITPNTGTPSKGKQGPRGQSGNKGPTGGTSSPFNNPFAALLGNPTDDGKKD